MARKGRKKPAVPKGDRFMEGTPTEAIRKALKAEQGAGGSGKAVLSGGHCNPLTCPDAVRSGLNGQTMGNILPDIGRLA